jgi:DNA-binding transcriptional LysR family regulator
MAKMDAPELDGLDWNLLRAFACVIELGSLTRAAERLGLSQPTLSRQIAELEAQLGAPLFERTGRRLRATELALQLQEPAERMRAAARALGPLAQQQRGTLAGTVRITASEPVAAYVLPRLLLGLTEQHPDIELELVASNRIDNLLEREADLAVRMVQPTQGTVIARHLGDWTLGFYAHRDYLARVGGHIDPQRIAEYRWIGLDRNPQLIDGFREAGHSIDRHFFALRSDNMMVGMEAVRAGQGIGVLSQPVAATDAALVQVLPEQPLPSLPVWLVAHRELRSSQRLRLVFDLLAAGLQALGTKPAEGPAGA